MQSSLLLLFFHHMIMLSLVLEVVAAFSLLPLVLPTTTCPPKYLAGSDVHLRSDEMASSYRTTLARTFHEPNASDKT